MAEYVMTQRFEIIEETTVGKMLKKTFTDEPSAKGSRYSFKPGEYFNKKFVIKNQLDEPSRIRHNLDYLRLSVNSKQKVYVLQDAVETKEIK